MNERVRRSYLAASMQETWKIFVQHMHQERGKRAVTADLTRIDVLVTGAGRQAGVRADL